MSRIIPEELTDEELEFIANGCGPKVMGLGWLVPDDIFRDACIIHDIRYYVGGNEEDRYAADREFLRNMLDEADKQWWRRWWRWRAHIYYNAVRTLGKYIAFHYGKRKTREQLRGEMSYAYSSK